MEVSLGLLVQGSFLRHMKRLFDMWCSTESPMHNHFYCGLYVICYKNSLPRDTNMSDNDIYPSSHLLGQHVGQPDMHWKTSLLQSPSSGYIHSPAVEMSTRVKTSMMRRTVKNLILKHGNNAPIQNFPYIFTLSSRHPIYG